MNRLTLRAFLIFVAIDWPFSFLMTAAYAISLNLTSFDEYVLIALLYLPIFFIKQVIVGFHIALRVGYLDNWVRESQRGFRGADTVQNSAERHFRLPVEYALVFILVWILSYPLLSSMILLWPGQTLNVGGNIYMVTLFLVITVFFGATAVAFISMAWALEPAAEEISEVMAENEIFHDGSIFSIRWKTLILTLSICYAASGLIGSLAYKFYDHESLMLQKERGRTLALSLKESWAKDPEERRRSMLENPSSQSNGGTWALVFDMDQQSLRTPRAFPDELRQDMKHRLREPGRAVPSHFRGQGWVCTWIELNQSSYLGVVVPDALSEVPMTWFSIIVFASSIVIFPVICGFFYSSMIGKPVERLHEASDRLLRTGQIKGFQHIPVYHRDEVGNCVETLNSFLKNLKDLSLQTREVADGNLNVELAQRGDLHSDFQYMIDSLRSTVAEISRASTVLSNYGADILSASLQQENVSKEQAQSISTISLSMTEISMGLGKVSESLFKTQESVDLNLLKVEESFDRVRKLKERSDEIHSILETIRKISNKSRYLALNTYIEASRAGSDGASFRVIAKETRQLSEAVGESVGDIEKLVVKIRAASSKSVEVTLDSREFALSTAKLAEGIGAIADKQNQSIHSVARSVNDLSAAIHETAVTSQSNRALAENLSEMADKLANMFNNFQVSSREIPAQSSERNGVPPRLTISKSPLQRS